MTTTSVRVVIIEKEHYYNCPLMYIDCVLISSTHHGFFVQFYINNKREN